MRFKVDENLPAEVTQLLQQAGHNAVSVTDQNLGGSPDARVAAVCKEEKRAILTLDTGFGDIRTYPPSIFTGLIVLRLRAQDKLSVLRVVEDLIPALDKEPIKGHLWIVDEDSIRIRG